MPKRGHEAYEVLRRAILRQAKPDDPEQFWRDVREYGAETGWPGFTYFRDTIRFYERNKKAIWDLLVNLAEQTGEKNVFAMMAEFRTAPMVGDYETFANLMSWFAVEEVANWWLQMQTRSMA